MLGQVAGPVLFNAEDVTTVDAFGGFLVGEGEVKPERIGRVVQFR